MADDGANANDEDAQTAPASTWIGLICLSAISFWTQAVVTEERFVPALNVVATALQIPDDVAGATLMAAGASSPELLASITTLFITHSSLGIGTIVGSEIFNHLMICAGSIFAARNTQLHLNKAIVLREVFFYGLALAFLMIALSDRRDVDGTGVKRIFIQWHDGLLLFCGYIVYVLVCVYYGPIHLLINEALKVEQKDVVDSERPLSPVADIVSESPSMEKVLPFLRMISGEPSTNFHPDFETEQELYAHAHEHNSVTSSDVSSTSRMPRVIKFLVAPTRPKPSVIHGLEDRIWDHDKGALSCFLWEQSLFYTKARVDMNAWQLRWFTFRREAITSIPNRTFAKDEMRYPDFIQIEVDEAHLTLKMYSHGSESRDFIFMAPSEAVLLSVLDACQHMEHRYRSESKSDRSRAAIDADAFDTSFDSNASDVSVPPPLTKFPAGESRLRQLLHILLFPVTLLMQISVPDLRAMSNRRAKSRLFFAVLSIVLCIVWLVAGSYAMVMSLERLGALMRLPDSVIGCTISAAGTSLPNYVASQVAARQGLGNMAVSNAFGSNTFNIFVGLGLPWLIWTSMFGEYSGLEDDGITESVFILVAVLVAFIGLVFWSNFVLYRWHAYAFASAYVSYVIYVVAQGYL